MRPFIRWLLFTLCLLIFTGAMAWISLRMLDMEKQRRADANEAQVQEKIRLALWRMDSQASSLLIRENARPPYHYQAFYAPEDLFASRTQSIPKGQALLPSPLFGSLPDLVKLHFEMLPGMPALCSPQAPAGPQKDLATSWYAVSPQLQIASQKLGELDALLKKHPEVAQVPTAPVVEQAALKNVPGQVLPLPLPLPKVAEKGTITALEIQMASNASEQSQRAMILDNNISVEKEEMKRAPTKKFAPPPPKISSSAKKPNKPAVADAAAESASKPAAEAPPQSAAATSSSASEGYRPFSKETSYSSREALVPTQREAPPALAGDLQPAWLGSELVLTRQATLDGMPRLQGVWLDWPQLQNRLLESVRDLLPHATLQPLPPAQARTDASALVTLPVRLVAGQVPVILVAERSALKPVLAIAWFCLVSAALAIAFVLHRAVLLGERRGAFVSAVTHELRTPLTTFRLYSEMLADDMVPDAAQRKTYLQTLCDESTRLMHLVENVLAYSRIERGRTAGRMETVQLGRMLDRIAPRLEQRAAQADLKVVVDADEAAQQSHLRVDVMAIEQILLNLTDNACKYAAPDCSPRQLDLTLRADACTVTVIFRDYGPGLPDCLKKRLFQPFSKSATEAAHSAPGVGLGLALSRQLARELGGDLVAESPPGRGAAFRLTLKRLPNGDVE